MTSAFMQAFITGLGWLTLAAAVLVGLTVLAVLLVNWSWRRLQNVMSWAEMTQAVRQYQARKAPEEELFKSWRTAFRIGLLIGGATGLFVGFWWPVIRCLL